MHTIRPVKRFDSVSSNRASAEFMRNGIPTGSVRSVTSPAASREAQMGRTLVDEVVLPTIDKVRLNSW
jgi:serine/threonine-protein kinase 24/25/MST4